VRYARRALTISAALKLAPEGEDGRGKDDVIVRRSIFPSSLESIRATLMLGTTVVEGNKWAAETPVEAKKVEPDCSWR
jgi:hypothetical protein